MSRRALIPVVMLVAIAGTSLLLGRGEPGEPAAVRQAEARGVQQPDSFLVEGVPEEVRKFLAAGQSWRAARAMRRHLAQGDSRPEAVLLAARAEAGWGGWERVRELLQGRPWLGEVRGGEGLYWLGRALEEEEQWEEALRAYGAFLERAPADAAGDRRRAAELRRGLILLRLGRAEQGAALLHAMREQAPEVAPRIDVLAAEALAESGDTAGVRRLVQGEASGELLRRSRLALLRAYDRAGDPRGGAALARAFQAAARGSEGAAYALRGARMALAAGDTAAARAQLSRAMAEPGGSAARGAAELLAELPGLGADDRLRIARITDRHGANRTAARFYRAWLASDAGSDAEQREVRLRLGRALFDLGDYGDAVAALRPLLNASGNTGAEAMLLTGRAQYRRGNRAEARQTFFRLAERHPGTEAGSEGLFLVADLSHDARDVGTARTLYRRVASDFAGTDRSGLSLMRLGGIAFQQRDFAEAARAWEEYRSRYPSGERWLESTYWAGRAYEAAGDRAAAAARYRAVRERDPLSYYALRSAERLGEPYWPIPMGAAPADNPAARQRVEDWMRGVDLLREAGLHEEAEAQADRWVERAGNDPALLYPLAETLNERGYTVRGIRIGYQLRRAADQLNPRLLRILYPFPYRELIEAEAREKDLDPFLVAALIRQESTFKARIASPAGARGLMQLMPETGAAMARGVGIGGWNTELLYQPEINTHLGTRFLADQMRQHRGSLPSVFSAYNAGPHRVEQWKRFPEYDDEELFTERIPYRETRDYVKILTRNIALYRGLYGE